MAVKKTNSGNILLWQYFADDQPVSLQVINILGQNVYSDMIRFGKGGSFPLSLPDISSGLYQVMIHDSNNRNYKFNFIKK